MYGKTIILLGLSVTSLKNRLQATVYEVLNSNNLIKLISLERFASRVHYIKECLFDFYTRT